MGLYLHSVLKSKHEQNINTKMQSKKKAVPLKKNPVKKKVCKIVNQHSDTINTTKQRTFATIEQTMQFQDHKTSTRTTHFTSKRDCLDKMQANKLSPFSSPGKSITPRKRKSFSPIVVKQKQTKRSKKKQTLNLSNLNKKYSNPTAKTSRPQKQKIKINEKARTEFENEFIKRFHKLEEFNQKKITELSQQQMEASIRKLSKPMLALKRQASTKHSKTKNKREIIHQMHIKIKDKYRKVFPNLKSHQLKLLSAVVLIQRLWRQTKVKMMISQFLSPRNFVPHSSYNQTFGKISLKNSLMEDQVFIHPSETMRTQKSFPSLSSKSGQKMVQDLSSIENNNSQLLISPQKSSINLKDLEISDELTGSESSSKNKQILKYINMYRQVTLNSKKEKKKNRASKPNAFNFPESLSEKCLLQSLYKKRMSKIKSLKEKGEEKLLAIDIFLPSKSSEKTKEQYISPKKPEIVQLQERFYTEAQDEEYSVHKFEKQQLKLEDQTVGSLGNAANKIVQFLIQQFSEEFQAFTTKKCLKKKKRLPGIHINDQTIQTYLRLFIEYIRNQYTNYLENSFTVIDEMDFLKFLRVPPEEDLFRSLDESQEQQVLNYPVLPSTAFFEYQSIYEEKVFKIKEQDSKFSNFLSGLIKIHNKCLADSLLQLIEKDRQESIQFPWDQAGITKSKDKKLKEIQAKMNERIKQIQKTIVSISNTKLGKLHKKDVDCEEIILLKSLKQDYNRQGKDWKNHHELLEVRLEVAELIAMDLAKQLATQLNGLI